MHNGLINLQVLVLVLVEVEGPRAAVGEEEEEEEGEEDAAVGAVVSPVLPPFPLCWPQLPKLECFQSSSALLRVQNVILPHCRWGLLRTCSHCHQPRSLLCM